MIRSRFISAAAVAAMMAVPAFAASSNTSRDTSGASTNLPPCSSLEAGNSGHAHPQAGKLAGKSTGEAKEHSASPVHQDCASDATSSSGTSRSGASPSTATSPSATTSSAPSSASTAGSNAATNSSVTGSTANTDNSMTGSTSTVSPNIDLRGRSSVTIDNATSTGDQSLSNSTGAATGSQTSTDTTKQQSTTH